MADNQFLKSYLEDFSNLIKPDDDLIKSLIHIRDLLLEVKSHNKKVLIFGNGGSASIANISNNTPYFSIF